MRSYEKGLLKDSRYYHFYPSNITMSLYYYVLSCGHFYAQDGYRIDRTEGKTPLLIYVEKGELNLIYDNKNYKVKTGQACIFDGIKPHSYYCNTYCSFLFLHFSGNNSNKVVTHLINQNNSPVFDFSNSLKLYNELDTCITLVKHKRILSDMELCQLLYNCICILQTSNDVYLEKASSSSAIITNTIYYIKNNLHKTITIKELANHVNISTHYFSHLFKEETGTTPIEYVAVTKINHAKTILLTSNTSIQEISELLGYSSSSSFINAFKSRVKMSPRQYRQSDKQHAIENNSV